MKEASLIIITGHPGSGKTSIAKQLSEQSHIPYISKDALKERIFDSLGSGDKAWSLKVSSAAHRIMDDVIRQLLMVGSSVIVESNFKTEIDSGRFRALVEEYDSSCVEILCSAEGSILFERWNRRIRENERHGGHVEKIGLEQLRQDLALPYPPLDLPGRTIRLDTTDFSRLELPDLN